MNHIYSTLCILLGAIVLPFGHVADAQESGKPSYESVRITIPGGGEIPGAYFKGNGEQAVILIPGAIYGKESWFSLAEPLQKSGVASLCLNGGSQSVVTPAIRFLAEKGYKKFALVGGSLGGAAILAAAEADPNRGINKLVALAPYGGSPVSSTKIDKLFVYAKEDGFGTSNVKANFNDSAEPKKIVEYEGSDHAQALLLGKHKAAAIQLIVDFILKGQ